MSKVDTDAPCISRSFYSASAISNRALGPPLDIACRIHMLAHDQIVLESIERRFFEETLDPGAHQKTDRI